MVDTNHALSGMILQVDPKNLCVCPKHPGFIPIHSELLSFRMGLESQKRPMQSGGWMLKASEQFS